MDEWRSGAPFHSRFPDTPRRYEHTDGYEPSPAVAFIPLEVGRVLLYDA